MEEKIGIIGAGRLGSGLARALSEVGSSVIAVCDKEKAKGRKCAGLCGESTKYYPIEELPEELTILFLTVPDDTLSVVVKQLARIKSVTGYTIIAHTSGALASDVLSDLLPHTELIASMHPVQTLSGSENDWKRLFGIYFSLEGNPIALQRLQQLLQKLNGQVFTIDKKDKGLYHLGCVFASNYLVAVFAAATQIFQRIGFPEKKASKILEPLMMASANNVRQMGTAHAATGPITRGDVGTVSHHIEELQRNLPELLPSYLALGQQLADLVNDLPATNHERVHEIQELFSQKQKELFHQTS